MEWDIHERRRSMYLSPQVSEVARQQTSRLSNLAVQPPHFTSPRASGAELVPNAHHPRVTTALSSYRSFSGDLDNSLYSLSTEAREQTLSLS